MAAPEASITEPVTRPENWALEGSADRTARNSIPEAIRIFILNPKIRRASRAKCWVTTAGWRRTAFFRSDATIFLQASLYIFRQRAPDKLAEIVLQFRVRIAVDIQHVARLVEAPHDVLVHLGIQTHVIERVLHRVIGRRQI